MIRRGFTAGAAITLLLATTFHSDDAFARGGARAGGHRGGAVAVHGHRGSAVAVRGGHAYRGAAYHGGAYRRYGYGAAAVGAAAVGAAAVGASRAGCGYDTYGNWVCPHY